MTARVVRAGHWTSSQVDSGDGAVARWAAGTLAGDRFQADALLLATLDSGARESIGFWRSSRETGFPYANPRPFPWTLSNSSTGRIAQALGIRGPTYTLVGRSEALIGALGHAMDELETRPGSRALVVALDGLGMQVSQLAAMCLSTDPASYAVGSVVARGRPDAPADPDGGTASQTLAAALDRLAGGKEALVGSDRDGWFSFTPSSEIPTLVREDGEPLVGSDDIVGV